MRMSERSQRKVLAGGQHQRNVAAAFRFAVVLVPGSKKRDSTIINQVVISLFRYVISRGRASFPAHRLGGRSCSKNFLLSSTEV
jgi:hypothetical protein